MHRLCFLCAAMFFRCGFVDPNAGAAEPSEQIETYRQFANEHSGNAKAGEQLFLSEKKLGLHELPPHYRGGEERAEFGWDCR